MQLLLTISPFASVQRAMKTPPPTKMQSMHSLPFLKPSLRKTYIHRSLNFHRIPQPFWLSFSQLKLNRRLNTTHQGRKAACSLAASALPDSHVEDQRWLSSILESGSGLQGIPSHFSAQGGFAYRYGGEKSPSQHKSNFGVKAGSLNRGTYEINVGRVVLHHQNIKRFKITRFAAPASLIQGR